MKKYGFIFLAGVLLSGCASFNEKISELNSNTAEKRRFFVRTDWVRRVSEKDNLGFRKVNRMTPVVLGDLIIQGNSLDGVVAFDRLSGQEKWRLPIANGVEASAAQVKDRVFLGASDGNFYSIEASTGKIIWSFLTKAENLGEPLLDDGVVYFLSGNNILYALDASTGKQIWLYSRQDTSSFSIRGASKPAIKDGKVFVGFSDGSLVALSAKNGTPTWELLLNKNKKFRDIDSSPVIDGNNIYVSGFDDKLYCVSADKGELNWKIDGGGYSAVTVIGDKLIYPTSNGEVIALNKNNGNKVWSVKSKAGIATQVKQYKGMLVYGEAQGKLQFIDANSGKNIGSMEPGRGVFSAPFVDEKRNHVYFISGEANVYAIEAKWDKPDWYTEGTGL